MTSSPGAGHHHAAPADASAPLRVGHLPPAWNPTLPPPSRPLGVAILAVLLALGAVATILSGVFFLVNTYAGTLFPSSLLIVQNVDILGAAILIVLGAVLLALSQALWRQETWALWTTVAILFAGLTYLFFTDSITVLFLVFLVLFIYLLAVRQHFY